MGVLLKYSLRVLYEKKGNTEPEKLGEISRLKPGVTLTSHTYQPFI
jgi:hypothetical protein